MAPEMQLQHDRPLIGLVLQLSHLRLGRSIRKHKPLQNETWASALPRVVIPFTFAQQNLFSQVKNVSFQRFSLRAGEYEWRHSNMQAKSLGTSRFESVRLDHPKCILPIRRMALEVVEGKEFDFG